MKLTPNVTLTNLLNNRGDIVNMNNKKYVSWHKLLSEQRPSDS